MQDTFWDFFTEIKYKSSYFDAYRCCARRIDNSINFFTALLSATSIANWLIWGQHPKLWSVLIGVAQIIQIAKPYLPYSKHVAALKFAIPEIQTVLRQIEEVWNRGQHLEEIDDLEYSKHYNDYRKQYDAIVQKYVGDERIPVWKCLQKEAKEDTLRFFKYRYNTIEWSDLDAREEKTHTDAF
ncbi:MAG: hypothetical protein AAGU05_12395 [Anaerolineaceae bacterium]